jgi:hypothetical protein
MEITEIQDIKEEDLIFKAPFLIFDKKKREKARKRVMNLGGSRSLGRNRMEVIELVIRNGLYEYYSKIEELSNPLEMSRIFKEISGEANTPEEQSLRRIELSGLYWKNVLYPEAVRQICNRSIYREGSDASWLWVSAYIHTGPNPVDEHGQRRTGYLYNLIQYYKGCGEFQQTAIKRFLVHQIGDYPLGENLDFKIEDTDYEAIE